MSKPRKVRSKRISLILKSIPLKTRLYVLNEMMIQSYLIDAGFIPDGPWDDEKEEKYGKSFRKFSKELTKEQITEFKNWRKDNE